MARDNKSLKGQIEKLAVQESAPKEASKLIQKVEKVRTKQKSYIMDLRIHSPASLGYLGIEGIDTAPALVRLAQVKGLDLIAVTDYHSGTFIDRVKEAALQSSVTVLPGTVLHTTVPGCSDVVICAIFPENFGTKEVQAFLTELGVPKSAAGDKSFVVKQPFEHILAKIDEYSGVALPSRMDKTPYRMAIVPTLVEKYGFRAFDLAYADSVRYFKSRWPKIKFQLFSFSNANALAQVGSRIAKVKLQDPGFAGVRELIGRCAD